MAEELHLRLAALEEDDPWIIEQKTFDILKEYLQPSSSTSDVDAAKALDYLTPAKRKARGEEAETSESFLLEEWNTFCDIAKQIPHDHESQDKFVRLIKVLVLLPEETYDEDDSFPGDWNVWARSSTCENALRFALDEPPDEETTCEPSFTHYINLNSFTARILGAELTERPVYFSCWALHVALEQKPAKFPQVWECAVRAAAQWIEHAGGVIFRWFKSPDFPEAYFLNQKEIGPSSERWAFWEAAFRAVAEREDVGDETRVASQQAADTMRQILLNSKAETNGHVENEEDSSEESD